MNRGCTTRARGPRRSAPDRSLRCFAALGSLATVLLAAVSPGSPFLAARAWAAAPPASTVPPEGGGICKGGTSNGDPCGTLTICADPKSKCIADWIKGPGKTLTGTLTIIVDDHVMNWPTSSTDYPTCIFPVTAKRRATTLLLEIKRQGQVHVFAETYQNPANAQSAGIGFPFADQIDEMDLIGPSACDNWIAGRFRQPESSMAQQLLDLAGIAEVARPVIDTAKGRGPAVTLPHKAADDEAGSAIRCQVTIRFVRGLPVLEP